MRPKRCSDRTHPQTPPACGGPHARFLALQGDTAGALHQALTARQVVTDLRGDVLRIGFALYHDDGDVDALLGVLREIET